MTIKQLGGVFGRNPTFNDLTANSLTVNRLSTNGTVAEWQQDGTKVGSIGSASGVISYIVLDPRLSLKGAGLIGGSIDSSTGVLSPADKTGAAVDGAIQLGIGSKRFKSLYLSDGVYLGGVAAANLLDDYEEGAWTPVLSDASSGGNLGSATINKANYTKVGRSVTLSASLSDIVTTGMGTSLSLYIQGLPFTSASSNSSFGAVKIDSVALQGGRTSAVCEVSDSDAWLRFWAIGDAIADTPIDCGDITSGSSDIFFTISYHV